MDPVEAVDRYFCQVCEMPESELDSDSRRLVRVWHSFGLIVNGGLHSYLCSVGDEATGIATAYLEAGLPQCSEALMVAHGLWREYGAAGSPDASDPDEFRERFDAELDELESAICDQEALIAGQLLDATHTRSSGR